MELFNCNIAIFIILAISIPEIWSIKESKNVEYKTKQVDKTLDPLANRPLSENENGDVNRNREHTKDALSRVKRQFYDPYYRRWPVPIPIIFGGGGWFGPGFGRGFGGRGFGGRGFGGRGFGGGRGIGGFGGHGIGGGGHGGRG